MLTAEYDGGHRAHDAEERAVDGVLPDGRWCVGHVAAGRWLRDWNIEGKKIIDKK